MSRPRCEVLLVLFLLLAVCLPRDQRPQLALLAAPPRVDVEVVGRHGERVVDPRGDPLDRLALKDGHLHGLDGLLQAGRVADVAVGVLVDAPREDAPVARERRRPPLDEAWQALIAQPAQRLVVVVAPRPQLAVDRDGHRVHPAAGDAHDALRAQARHHQRHERVARVVVAVAQTELSAVAVAHDHHVAGLVAVEPELPDPPLLRSGLALRHVPLALLPRRRTRAKDKALGRRCPGAAPEDKAATSAGCGRSTAKDEARYTGSCARTTASSSECKASARRAPTTSERTARRAAATARWRRVDDVPV
eukprot:scaffold128378_cov63-Phaeocystis_antarctica.AAC.1